MTQKRLKELQEKYPEAKWIKKQLKDMQKAAAYARRKARENPEKKRADARAWNEKHPGRNSEHVRTFRKANPRAARSHSMMYYHKISQDQWDELFEKQDGVCPICLDPMELPVVDHDHDTGLIRGILCNTCNSGLGMFKEDTFRLRGAIKYLKAHGKPDPYLYGN